MPPKKADNKDLLSSVEYFIKVISVQYELQGQESVDLQNETKSELKDLIEIISRHDIIEYAREKGLYIDLNNLSEKEKNSKTFKPDPSKTELNSDIMTNAFVLLMEDKEMAIRKAKKDIQDAKNKQTKADPKAKGKKEEQTIVEEEVVEKQQEVIDKIYFLNDFPNYEELNNMKGQLNIDCFIISQQEKNKEAQVDMSILDQLHMSQEGIRQKLDQFIEDNKASKAEDSNTNQHTSLDKLLELRIWITKEQERGIKLEVVDNKVQLITSLGSKIIEIGVQFIEQLKSYETFTKSALITPLLTQNIDIPAIKQSWKVNYYYKQISVSDQSTTDLEKVLDALMYQIQMEQHSSQTNNVQEFDSTNDKSFIKDHLTSTGEFLLGETSKIKEKSILQRPGESHNYLQYLQTFPHQHNIQHTYDPDTQKIKAQQQITQVNSSLNPSDFQQANVLQQFTQMMTQQIKERSWCFSDRTYREHLTPQQARLRMHSLELEEMSICHHQNIKDRQLYVIIYANNPPGRVLHNYFTYKHNLLPDLPLYRDRQSLYDQQDSFYSLPQIMLIQQKQQLMYPDDRSIMRVEENSLGGHHQKVIKCSVRVEEGNTMGIKTGLFYYQFLQGLRLVFSIRNPPIQLHVISQQLILTFNHQGHIQQQLIPNTYEQETKQHPQMVTRQQFTLRKGSEKRRTIDNKGKVRKYMADGTIEIFTPNGQIYENKKNGVFIITYQDGTRFHYNQKTKERRQLSSIETVIRYDIEEGKRVVIRKERSAFSQETANGRLVSRFYDGTVIDSNPSTKTVTIDHPSYRRVSIEYDEVKQRMGSVIGEGSSFASIGYNNLMERSYSGLIIRTDLDPQGSSYMLHYQEKQQLAVNKTIIQWIYLFYSSDGSLLKFSQDGTLLYLGQHARKRIEQSSPIDSFIQLFGVKEERKQGVYSGDLHLGYIETRDSQSNQFRINSDGNVTANVSVSLVQQDHHSQPNINIDNGQYINPNNMFLPPPQEWITPQLFLLEEHTAYQYHQSDIFQVLSNSNQSNTLTYPHPTTTSHILYHHDTSSTNNFVSLGTQPTPTVLSQLILPQQQAPVHYQNKPKQVINYRQFTQFNDLSTSCSSQDSLAQYQIDNIVRDKLAKYSRIIPDEAHQDAVYIIHLFNQLIYQYQRNSIYK